MRRFFGKRRLWMESSHKDERRRRRRRDDDDDDDDDDEEMLHKCAFVIIRKVLLHYLILFAAALTLILFLGSFSHKLQTISHMFASSKTDKSHEVCANKAPLTKAPSSLHSLKSFSYSVIKLVRMELMLLSLQS